MIAGLPSLRPRKPIRSLEAPSGRSHHGSRPSKTGAGLPRAAKIRCASHTPIFVFAVAVRTQSTIYPAVRTHLAPHSPQSPTRRPASRPKAAYVHVLPPPLAPRVLVGVGCSRGRDDHSGHGRAPFRRRGALSDPEPQLSRALREASTGGLRVVVPVRVVASWCAAMAHRECAKRWTCRTCRHSSRPKPVEGR